MIELECKYCHIVFKCNGDKICPSSVTRDCSCKNCTIKNNLDNNSESLDECYKGDITEREKVVFT